MIVIGCTRIKTNGYQRRATFVRPGRIGLAFRHVLPNHERTRTSTGVPTIFVGQLKALWCQLVLATIIGSTHGRRFYKQIRQGLEALTHPSQNESELRYDMEEVSALRREPQSRIFPQFALCQLSAWTQTHATTVTTNYLCSSLMTEGHA